MICNLFSLLQILILQILLMAIHLPQLKQALMNVLNDLEKDSNIQLSWLKKNFLKANPQKYNLLLSTEKTLRNKNWYLVDFWESCRIIMHKSESKVLRVDWSLSFTERKHSFITPQFSCATIIWMSHSRKLNRWLTIFTKECWDYFIRTTIFFWWPIGQS